MRGFKRSIMVIRAALKAELDGIQCMFLEPHVHSAVSLLVGCFHEKS